MGGWKTQMKISAYVEKSYMKNRLFSLSDTDMNPDGRNEPFNNLQRHLEASGISLQTHDIIGLDSSDAILFLRLPRRFNWKRYQSKIKILLLLESEVYDKYSHDINNHHNINYVFSWKDFEYGSKKTDGKYYKIKIPHKLPVFENTADISERSGIVMIAANKRQRGANTNFNIRDNFLLHAIKKNYNVSLYGHGWTLKHYKFPVINKILQLISVEPRENRFNKIYRGSIETKSKILRKSKFCLIFENQNTLNYNTEKIYDALMYGAVPVYFGNVQGLPAEITRAIIHVRDMDELIYFFEIGQFKNEFENTSSFIDSYNSFLSRSIASEYRWNDRSLLVKTLVSISQSLIR
jgi:hypothetical protein